MNHAVGFRLVGKRSYWLSRIVPGVGSGVYNRVSCACLPPPPPPPHCHRSRHVCSQPLGKLPLGLFIALGCGISDSKMAKIPAVCYC